MFVSLHTTQENEAACYNDCLNFEAESQRDPHMEKAAAVETLLRVMPFLLKGGVAGCISSLDLSFNVMMIQLFHLAVCAVVPSCVAC